MNKPESFAPVVIVGIDNRKGSVNGVFGTQHRVYCSPRFFARRRNFCKLFACKQRVRVLKNVLSVEIFGNAVKKTRPKIFFYVFADDVYYAFKPALFCIVGGKVEQGFTVFSYRVDLFYTAVPAAESRSQNQ